MSLSEKTKLIQAWAGVTQDGIWGNQTADAIIAKAGISAPGTTPGVKVCVDPGHGFANRKPGLFDPGCTSGGFEEAAIVLDWAFALKDALQARGIAWFMTRDNQAVPTPVSVRDNMAKEAGCSHFISIHINDADGPSAHGTETLYNADRLFAQRVQAALLAGLGLTDRGVKHRPDLAVLQFGDNACLIELGFIQNPTDRAAFMDPVRRKATCSMIAALF